MQKLLKKLIAFQSDKNHPQEINKCFAFVVDYLRKAGLKMKTYNSNSKPSLLAARILKKHYQYILNGHLDVVPANYLNAFKPICNGNKLYGRGAADMKGTVTAMIKLLEDHDLKNVDMCLMLTTDEESGGFDGVSYLLNNQGYSCDCAIVPDGGRNFELVIAEKGAMFIKILAKGKSAHGSRPWLGENAIEKLIAVYEDIKKNIPDSTVKNRWLPTINLGKISGGLATNQVPSQAEIFLDIRYPLKQQRKNIISLINKVVGKYSQVNYQILTEGNTTNNSLTNKYLKKIIQVTKKQNINLKFLKAHGASDGRFFSAKNIPVIMFSSLSSEAHIDNEWIDLKSLDKFYLILKIFLLK